MEVRKIRVENLRKLVAERGPTAARFAREHGLDPNYLSQLFNGHRSFGEKTARRIEEHAGIKAGALDVAEGGFEPAPDNFVEIPFRTVRLRGSDDAATGFIVDYEENEETTPLLYRKDWIRRNGYREDRLLARQVTGSSMEPTLFDGDQVLINLEARTPRHAAVYSLIVDGHPLIKRLRKRADEWWITSDNPVYARSDLPLENLEQIVGQVIERTSSVI